MYIIKPIMPKLFSLFSRGQQKETPTPMLGVGSVVHERYRLDAEIGRGGMGVVYRAHDPQTGHDVAIKVVNWQKANALTLQQFSNESQITSRLKHPHIVEVYETGTVNSGNAEPLPFIVMEFVQGISLSDISGLTIRRVLNIGQQICEALEYAHSQGLVYRDLKPGNVLIEKSGFQFFVKLTDFGLARPREQSYDPSESTAAGTLFYLAPELISGQPADVASDLYALGATLYEMLTGRVPFSAFDEETILAQHLEARVTPPSQSRANVPPALEAIILRLLEKNPSDRFASAREVCDLLEQIIVERKGSGSRGNIRPLSREFVGHEVEHIKGLLESNRLVTILGDDATLALTVGTQLAGEFQDGAWVVNLETIPNPGLVLSAVATTLGVLAVPNRPMAVCLVETLQEKNLLLILSHCERVIGACAQLVRTILQTCPDVEILAVSEKGLGVEGERVVESSE